MKRPREDENEKSIQQQEKKKKRKGFTVGPDNLPDGTYRRKAQKIKTDLIQKAKVKKEYAKIKTAQQEEEDQREKLKHQNLHSLDVIQQNENGNQVSSSLELHPDRQAMLQTESEPHQDLYHQKFQSQSQRNTNKSNDQFNNPNRQRREKQSRYTKDFEVAEQRKKEFEERQKAREARDRDRKQMAKAKIPGRDGKIKLGKQGNVLLGRIKHMMDEGKI